MSAFMTGADFLKLAAQVQKKAQKIMETTAKEAFAEKRPEMQLKFEEEYKNSMQKFYDAYPRSLYSPRESLKDMFETSAEGEFAIKLIVDSDKMGKDRRGGDLFDKVFIKGYHGGAESGDQTVFSTSGFIMDTPHPNPGTPHYRTGPGFLFWGRAAAKSTPPLELYNEGVKKVITEFEPIISQLWDKKIEARKNELWI